VTDNVLRFFIRGRSRNINDDRSITSNGKTPNIITSNLIITLTDLFSLTSNAITMSEITSNGIESNGMTSNGISTTNVII